MTDGMGSTGGMESSDGKESTTDRRTQSGRGVVAILAIVALLAVPMAATAASVPGPAVDQQSPTPEFVVDLAADGSAEVTLTTTFDLTTDVERDAFEALRANETARNERTDEFTQRMNAVATRAASETDRSMSIREPALTFNTHNDTGIVALSVTWEGLAATDGDRLVLTEPFDAGFTSDRPVTVVAPAGYSLTEVAPAPESRTATSATWVPGTKFEGFEATVRPVDESDDSIGIAAIGGGIALLGALGSSGLLLYHRRNGE